jgi:hypothetical protein
MTGWIEPTPEQLDDARRALAESRIPERHALHYIGGILTRFNTAYEDVGCLRRALAMYRVFDEEIDGREVPGA